MLSWPEFRLEPRLAPSETQILVSPLSGTSTEKLGRDATKMYRNLIWDYQYVSCDYRRRDKQDARDVSSARGRRWRMDVGRVSSRDRHCRFFQTEAERRRREAGVKQSMEIRVRSCMHVCMYVGGWVWYLELSREPRHVAQQTRYQNVGLGNGHCLGTISSGCDF